MLTDGRTYMTKLIVAFRSFADAPKNGGYTKPNNAIAKNQMQQVYRGYPARHCCAEFAASLSRRNNGFVA
jgi:hypothetical protein